MSKKQPKTRQVIEEKEERIAREWEAFTVQFYRHQMKHQANEISDKKQTRALHHAS